MNARQFVNSTLCAIFSHIPLFSLGLSKVVSFINPYFYSKGLIRSHKFRSAIANFVVCYLFVLIFCFALQGMFAFTADRFWPTDSGHSDQINFLDDVWNLLNYLIVVQSYCFFGLMFLLSITQMESKIQASGLAKFIVIEPQKPSNHRGIFGLIVILLIALNSSAQYAQEVATIPSSLYWFHDRKIDDIYIFGNRGYYYLFINLMLLIFCVFVALMHIELFSILGRVSKSLSIKNDPVTEKNLDFWKNEHLIKEAFSPFTETVIWSKGFLLSIAFNLYTWKMSAITIKPDQSLVLIDWTIFLVAIIGMWITSFPRYMIQYQIFLIRKEVGFHLYQDLRMPWVLGWSGFVDILVIVYLGKILLSDSTQKIFNDFLH